MGGHFGPKLTPLIDPIKGGGIWGGKTGGIFDGKLGVKNGRFFDQFLLKFLPPVSELFHFFYKNFLDKFSKKYYKYYIF